MKDAIKGSGAISVSGGPSVLVALLAVLALLAGCGERTQAEADARPTIVASIYPLADLVAQVAGEDFTVESLLPPGATPHGFELTADRVRMLADAQVLVVVGRGLDPWAERAAGKVNGSLPVWRMAAMIGPDAATQEQTPPDEPHAEHSHDEHHHHDASIPNPHLWLDPVFVAEFVTHLSEALAQRYPEQAEAIRRNTQDVLASVQAVDAAYREQLADVPRKELVTFHNAFDLLAERYGLKVVAHLTPIEMSPGGEVTPNRLVAAVEAVRKYGLRVVYAEPQFPESAVQSLQQETGAALLRLDPLGHPNRAGYRNWQELMQSNLATLVDGQSREGEE